MNSGYIYILINNSMEGLIKIGSTTLGAKKRASHLSANTSVPTPFIVAYEVYVDEYLEMEKRIHDELADFRVNPNREFFRYPLNKAIDLINRLNGSNKRNDEKFEAIEILPLILNKYGENIDPCISSMRICQDTERVYFEFTKDQYIAGYLKDQMITRTDLGFIVDGINKDYDEDIMLFMPGYRLDENVRIFLELDDISMANCVGEIFIEEWSPIE